MIIAYARCTNWDSQNMLQLIGWGYLGGLFQILNEPLLNKSMTKI